ncbi:hypothetical protein SAMN04487957_10595 [Halomonas shengliensis]|uniref:Uncharacterized protein n=1 Tax=Halomonas shengliensis TaxID=419597 RepID=A0A1H0IES2_9GAMM|nr:hypothetical protein [Halomonas shengliensis]SDO29957.1 hypothetical protein SAMN04487957_10595 [Halomonas shengliensis]
MPILQGDIKLLKSERMTDNEDGGGRITGTEIADGLSNEIFNDVSDLDRVYGRTSLRKVFAGVETDDTAFYFGSHVIVDQAPDDPNVSVLAFATGSPTDQRAEARNRIEGYVVAGPLSRLRLYGDQLPGQRQVLAYLRTGETPPDIGDVLVLRTEAGADAGDEQFIRITSVESNDQIFTDGSGDFTRQVLTLGISTELTTRFHGHEPTRSTSTQPDTRIRMTQVADASRYFGLSRLAMAASLGSNQVQVQSVYQPIVPSTQGESPVVDVHVGGNVAVAVQSGGITHEIPQVGETLQIPVSLNNRGYSYTRNLQPLPAPGTVVVEFLALGKWYQLRDENGTGELTGSGTGQVNFATGSLSITLQELPDVDSAILVYWGSPIHYRDRAGYQVPFPTPGLRFELDHGGVVPGSITVRWMSGEVEVQATDDGQGNLTGSGTGVVVYGWRDQVNGDRPGLVWIEFNDGSWPDANSLVVVDYEFGASDTATFNPSVDGAGFVQLQLPDAPLKPGSVGLEFTITRRDYTNGGSATYMGVASLPNRREETRESQTQITRRLYDDGVGGISGAEGTVDYDTGLVTAKVLEESEVQSYERDGRYGPAEWHERTITDKFPSGSAVIARWQPQVVNSTQASVQRNPNPLRVSLLPLIQDQVVPGTLRFTFRGATYLDRDGSLYRDVDPQTGAGLYSGTIDYSAAEVVLEDWGASGSNQISITSLVTVLGNWTIYDVFFRTPGSPIQVGELSLLATTAGGELLQGQAQFNATITGDQLEGEVDYTTGVASVRFGELVDDSTLTPEEKNEPWYDPANVEDGMIWRPEPVLPSTARFNTVVLTSLPLDAELLGLDPVRLPPDGRVPIFRPAQVAVVHHTAKTAWPLGTTAGDTLDVGRTRLALGHVEDANGDKLPEADYSVDLDAGTFALDAGADLSGVAEPLYAVHRIEDMVLISDVQIGGQITLIGQLSHDYPAEETLVSSALIGGDLQARWSNLFDQSTWTNVWSDSLIGSETSAEYNATTYPLEVTNRGAITERWALRFTSTSGGNIVGESVGQIGTFSINSETAPNNPNTGVPYFRIPAGGWGSGWSAGNVLRFNTIGCNLPVWLARTVLQGDSPGGDFRFRVQVRGNVDA